MLTQRSNLVIGLTYFELGDYDVSINYLKSVNTDNENYPQALMGLGWCYIKKQQFQYVISPLEKFAKKFPAHHLIPEVFLLLGQAHLKIRLYEKAVNYFNNLLNMFPKSYDNVNINKEIENSLKPFKERLEKQQLDLLLVEIDLLDAFQIVSKKWIPKFMLEEIEAVKNHSSKLIDQINSEKAKIDDMLQLIEQLRLKLEVRTKDWRTYAEYGISRALFLKGQNR